MSSRSFVCCKLYLLVEDNVFELSLVTDWHALLVRTEWEKQDKKYGCLHRAFVTVCINGLIMFVHTIH